MTDWKTVLASKTVWAGIVTILASLVGLMGYTIAADDQANLATLATQAVTVVSGIVTIIGRVTATKRLG